MESNAGPRHRDMGTSPQTSYAVHEPKSKTRLKVLDFVQSGGRYWIRTSDLCDVNAAL